MNREIKFRGFDRVANNWDKTVRDIEIVGNNFENPELINVRYW